MDNNNNNNSGTNTILIVVVLVLVVAFGVWYLKGGFGGGAPAADDKAEFNLNVEAPTGGSGGADAGGQPQ